MSIKARKSLSSYTLSEETSPETILQKMQSFMGDIVSFPNARRFYPPIVAQAGDRDQGGDRDVPQPFVRRTSPRSITYEKHARRRKAFRVCNQNGRKNCRLDRLRLRRDTCGGSPPRFFE